MGSTLLGRVAAAAAGRTGQALAVRKKMQEARDKKAAAADAQAKAADKALEAAREEQGLAADELNRAKAAARVKNGTAAELAARAQRLIDAQRRAQAADAAIDPATKAAAKASRGAAGAQATAETGVPGTRLADGLKAGLAGAGVAAFREITGSAKQGFGLVFGEFSKYLSPLRMLGVALNSKSSGQEAAATGFSAIGNVIGSLFMPAFLLLGATLMTLAGQLQGDVLTGVKKMAGELPKLAAAIGDAVKSIKRYANQLGDVKRGRDVITDSMATKFASVGEGLGVLPKGTTAITRDDWKESRKAYAEGGAAAGKGERGEAGSRRRRGRSGSSASPAGCCATRRRGRGSADSRAWRPPRPTSAGC